MRIVFLGINYWPDETGIAPFTTGRCEYLASQGHQVTMLTGFPYYPTWRIPEQYRGRLFSREERNGVTILRSWLYVPEQVNAMRRILHEASFIASSVAARHGDWCKARPDLLVATTPPLALSLSAILLSRIWKIPFVQHVPDLQPDAAVDLGMLRPGRLTRSSLWHRADGLSQGGAGLDSDRGDARQDRQQGNPDRRRWCCFRTGPDPSYFRCRPTEAAREFRRSLGLGNELLVVHAGNMGVKQGLEVILGAAERSREDRSIRYLLVGDGSVRQQLEQRAKSLHLTILHSSLCYPTINFWICLRRAT